MEHTKRWASRASTLLLAVLLGACGGPVELDDHTVGDSTTAETEATSPGAEPEEMAEVTPEQLAQLKGIRRLFVLIKGEEAAASLLEAEPKTIRMTKGGGFTVEVLDDKAGYMRLYARMAEFSVTMTYWQLEDSTQLVGEVVRGCGPVCSDDVRFYQVKGERVEELAASRVLPYIDPDMFLANAAAFSAEGKEGGRELMYELPQRGTSIRVELGEVAFENLYEEEVEPQIKWLAIELEWNGGLGFTLGKITQPDQQ